MNARQAVLLGPYQVAVREVELPAPGPEQVPVATEARAGRAGPRAGITLGRSAAVLGLGVIGQFALRCLRAAGAHPVVGIDSVAMRRRAARAAGADHVLDPSAGDPRRQLADLLGDRGAEVVA